MSVIIRHNPHCSKSRRTLEILNDSGLRPVVVEYLKTPPGPSALRDVLGQLGMGPRQLMRVGETPFRDLGLHDESLSDGFLIQAMHDYPVLIERPVVRAGGRAALGRPPERVLDILDGQVPAP